MQRFRAAPMKGGSQIIDYALNTKKDEEKWDEF